MIIEVDSTLSPIIILKSLPTEVSNQDLEDYFIFCETLLSTAKEKLIILHDIDKARFLSGDQLLKIKRWCQKIEPLYLEKVEANCVITSSVLSRLIINSIKLLLPSKYSWETFSTMEEAMAWSTSIVQKQKKRPVK